jgi:hypothetical protein
MTPHRHRHPEIAAVAIGTTLLLTSQLTDSLEPYLGTNAITLYFALGFAALALSMAVLTGDALARRRGWDFDPTARRGLPTAILAAAAAGITAAVLIRHLHREIALDAWLALAGSTLLLLAAATRLDWPARLRTARARGHAKPSTSGPRHTAQNGLRERTPSVEPRRPAHNTDRHIRQRLRRLRRTRTPNTGSSAR